MTKNFRLILILFFLIFLNPIYVNSCDRAYNPSKITVAGGSITEILYFLEEQSKIVAVDLTSNFPEETKKFPSIGYVRNLSAEGVLSLKPTLVIGEDDMGPPDVVNQIKKTGIDIIILKEEHSSEGIIDKIKCVGEIIGEREKTIDIINNKIMPIKIELDNLSENLKNQNIKVMFILTMDSGSPIIGGKDTSADGFIKMIGARNAFDNFEGWKPVGTESIIDAAPDIILISNRGAHSYKNLDNMHNHPTVKYTPAAINKNIIALDGMQMLGFGPRTIETALYLSKKFQTIENN